MIDRQQRGENAYFLNAITETDLMALAEITQEPVAPEPTLELEPTPKPAPEKKGNSGALLLVLAKSQTDPVPFIT